MRKRLLSLFLVLVLCLTLAPAGAAAEAETAGAADSAPAEPCGEAPVPDDGEGGGDDIWAAVEALERERLPEDPAEADYIALLPQIEALAAADAHYVPDSMYYEGDILVWRTDNGCANGYCPSLRAQIAADGPGGDLAPPVLDGAEQTMTSRSTAFLSPYYGKEQHDNTLYYALQEVAAYTGGHTTAWRKQDATIDRLANAIATCCVVFHNGHGSGGFIALTTRDGITEADYEIDRSFAYGHGYHVLNTGTDEVLVDGVAIVNHMKKPADHNLVYFASCEGMINDALAGPLRDNGVEAVIGWSRSVSQITGRDIGKFIAAYLITEHTLSRAMEKVKVNMGLAACLGPTPISWDWRHYKGGPKAATTEEQARERDIAFLIVESDQDPYPDDVQKSQTVLSAWELPAAVAGDIDLTVTKGTLICMAFDGAGAAKLTGGDAFRVISGSFPPGVGYRFVKENGNYIPELYGTPTASGLYEAAVEVGLLKGGKEERRVRILVLDTEEDLKRNTQEQEVMAGDDLDIVLDLADTSGIFRFEPPDVLSVPGMTLLREGDELHLCGTIAEAGSYAMSCRITHNDGQLWEHTVKLTVMAGVSDMSDSFSVKTGVTIDRDLGLGGAEAVLSLEQLGGALPPGMTLDYSQDVFPHVYGTCAEPGEYTALFRIITGDAQIIYLTLSIRVYAPAAFLNVFTIDLARGGARVSREDFDQYLRNALVYANNHGQIRLKASGSAWTIDLDKSGGPDVTMTEEGGYILFTLVSGASVTEDDYTLTLSDAARDEIDEDGVSMYARSIAFHLTDYYDLYIDGTQATSRNRNDILGNGVFSFDGGDRLTVKGSYTGTSAQPVIRNAIDGLTVSVDADSTLAGKGNCIETSGGMTVTGAGKLTLDTRQNGIRAEKALVTLDHVTLCVTAEKTCLLGTGSFSVHLRAIHSDLTLIGAEAANGFWSIGLYDCGFEYPVFGRVGDVEHRACLTDAENTILKRAQITAYETKYALTVDGVQVTNRNRSDVLGNGKFSYDGAGTLTISGSYTSGQKNAVVDSRIDGLRIVCAEDITLGTGGTACLSLNGDTTLTGGPLTAESSSVLGRGISLGLGAGLTVQDMTLTAGGSRRGITGDGTGESLLVRASDVTATGSNAAVWNLDGGVTLDGCELLEPIGGSFSGGQYLEADGAAAAKTVKIVSEHVIEGSLSVSGGTMTYTLTLPDDGSEITLLAAWYDGAGQMLGCAEKAVTCAGFALGETLPVEPGADTYKLFILDENDMPLAPALVQ